MPADTVSILEACGIRPSAQRVAVAEHVLHTDKHPSADEVWSRVRKTFPQLSRATVYNTLNLLVAKGLLRSFALTEGRVVFDPNVANHHHFIDDESGAILDVPWEAIELAREPTLPGFEVSEYQVVLRGRRSRSGGRR